jgi:hypothetical protein
MIVTRKTHPGGCNVFDANGLQWNALRWVNTETGEAEQCVLDANGQKQLDATMKSLLTQKVTLATPVLLMPIKHDNPADELPQPAEWPKARRELPHE